jgi:signal transduction histidine kinase
LPYGALTSTGLEVPPRAAPRWPPVLYFVTGAFVSALGLIALAGWVMGLPRLTDFGSGRVPMAPSTATLLVLQGAGLALGERRSALSRLRAGLAWLTLLTALAVLALRIAGIQSGAEHLGLRITGTVAGAPVGFMAGATAIAFICASTSMLLGSSATGGSRLALLSPWLAGALFANAAIFLIAYVIGTPLLQGGGYIPPALNTTLAFLPLSVGLIAASRRHAHLPSLPLRASPSVWFVALFVVVAVGMLAAARRSYREYAFHYRQEVERQLAAIADLKVEELSRWRGERLGDGEVLFGNEYFAGLVHRRLSTPGDRDAPVRLHRWLERIREGSHYERVYLTDARGIEVASYPGDLQPSSPFLTAAVAASLLSRQVTFFDLHRDSPDAAVHMSVLTPIFSPVDGRTPLGVVAMTIDPRAYLFPYLKRWPAESRSAETLLVRREGEEVVFLNELRFSPAPPLSLRAPLSRLRLPAATAAMGTEGMIEGVDYRGEEVIAALRAIPGSPWHLVARMDLTEIHGPLRERLWQNVLLVAALLIAGGAGFLLLWRRHSLRFYRERYEAAEALRASEAELRARNDELTRFTYTVSHDLKSPLVTIQTFVGYLEKDVAAGNPSGMARDIEFVRNAAQKMGGLLDDLLNLSRIGRKSNPAEDVPLQAVVDEALALVAGRISERGARVVVTEDPIVLHGDRIRLVEVLQNLLDNAIKFSGDGPGPRVEIGAEPGEGEVILYVRDEGVGMDPRHLPRIFGLFEKLDPRSEGSGVGLALVRRIVEVHGGRIWAESDGPGRGTCFRFTLAGTRRAKERT